MHLLSLEFSCLSSLQPVKRYIIVTDIDWVEIRNNASIQKTKIIGVAVIYKDRELFIYYELQRNNIQLFTSGVRLSGERTSRKKSEGLKFLGQRLPVELKKAMASATSPKK